MAYMWRKHACSSGKKPPSDVPPGHLAVMVGQTNRRFVIRADYLNHPILQKLLDIAYEEYGFNKAGPLVIPCEELLFEDIIQSLKGCRSPFGFTCHVALEKLELSLRKDTVPLLHGANGRK